MSDATPTPPEPPSDAALTAAAGLAPKKRPLVPILLGLNTLLLLGAVAFFATRAPPAAPAEPRPAAAKEGEPGGTGGIGPTVRLPDVVVHLRNPEAERYLKASFELEVGAELDKDRVNAHLPRIRETILTWLSDRTAEELRGSEGIERAKKELLARVGAQVPQSPVRAIYITDLVVQ